MFWRSNRLHFFMAITVVALIGSVCGAPAQQFGAEIGEMGRMSYGTTNVQPAEPWAEEQPLVWGEVRTWQGDNWTWAAGARARVGDDRDAELTFFHMDIRGDDPVGGAVRRSEATLVGLNFRWVAHRDERVTLSVIPGAEFPIGSTKGTNTLTSATAVADDIIPLISMPVEFRTEQGTIYTVVPRFIGFAHSPELADGTQIVGFGRVLALAGAAQHDFGDFSAHADLALPLTKYNSVSKRTNEPTKDPVWSVGGAWHGTADLRVDLFMTNAAGPTAATSIIATPGQSVGVGLRVSGQF